MTNAALLAFVLGFAIGIVFVGALVLINARMKASDARAIQPERGI